MNKTINYSGGELRNVEYVISQDNLNLIINAVQKYNLKPSFLITQMFIESHWGDKKTSYVGSVDNNWSGISEPFSTPIDLDINMSRGTARPDNEGGYYIHFATLNDFFKAFSFVVSKRNGLYNVEGAASLEAYCKGLFRVGGARADYAASGYDNYLELMLPTYNAIKKQNPGKFELIDSIADNSPILDDNKILEEEQDMFTFDCNGTVFLKQGDRAKWFNDSKKLAKLREEYKRVYGKDLMNIGTVDAKQRDEFTR
ncbi:hypothetical protein BG261_08270 [Floricoccus tropicus]|uniref:Mannosyl-glycoprotein endo-beta-N-acetylglucosamidase-like domain-containing protein n=1 Tax=Floricoccus tropicus TaxID=1859473 RepID=A0A1E8GJ49_9LACT|nr:glucosaminidase domain-containing protein [Floricoccus tropicus]OFI48269.1 hypothetical protein BG261_08270 [Floricoccus tropicus]